MGASEPRRRRGRVLVIDCDALAGNATATALAAAGYEVRSCEGWRGVISILNSLLPDIVLVELDMPVLSGDRVCELIRKNARRKQTLLYFFSGEPEDALSAAVTRCGADGAIRKGIGAHALVEKIDAILGREEYDEPISEDTVGGSDAWQPPGTPN